MIPQWEIQSPLPVGRSSCVRCHQVIRQEDYHTKGRKRHAHPVGTPGRHVRRAVCDCGCFAVDFYFVFDLEKIRSRHTTSLRYMPFFDIRSKFEGSKNAYA